MTIEVGLSVYSGLAGNTVPYLDSVAGPFGSLWFPDHLQSNEEGVMEGWSMLAFHLARHPNKVCGHQVLCNEFRPPGLVAKMAASTQVLSGGRLVLGIGAGWHGDEAAAYGMDFGSAPRRIARLGEAIELIRALWSGAPVNHRGEHYAVDGARCLPAPNPTPPVMVGGSGERYLLAVVASHADWWNHIYRDPAEFRHKLGVLRSHCERIGRDPDEIVPVLGAQVLIGESEQDVRHLVDDPQVRSVERNGIAGTPEQVTETLLAGVGAGAGKVIVGFADSPRTDGTELFIRDVLPALT